MVNQPRVLHPVTLNWSQDNIHKDFRPRVMPANTPDPEAVPADVQREIDEEYGESPVDPRDVPTQLEEVKTSPIERNSSGNSVQPSPTPRSPGWSLPPAPSSAPATEATPTPGSQEKVSSDSATTPKKSAGPAQ